MKNVDITRIPFPNITLKGQWRGIVYAIVSERDTLENHNIVVEDCIDKIKSDFDEKNHWTVSLREEKRELVYADEDRKQWCTLVQFRVRDSY